jgi:hypothetical protein
LTCGQESCKESRRVYKERSPLYLNAGVSFIILFFSQFTSPIVTTNIRTWFASAIPYKSGSMVNGNLIN